MVHHRQELMTDATWYRAGANSELGKSSRAEAFASEQTPLATRSTSIRIKPQLESSDQVPLRLLVRGMIL
jgi:hypothetical protein